MNKPVINYVWVGHNVICEKPVNGCYNLQGAIYICKSRDVAKDIAAFGKREGYDTFITNSPRMMCATRLSADYQKYKELIRKENYDQAKIYWDHEENVKDLGDYSYYRVTSIHCTFDY